MVIVCQVALCLSDYARLQRPPRQLILSFIHPVFCAPPSSLTDKILGTCSFFSQRKYPNWGRFRVFLSVDLFSCFRRFLFYLIHTSRTHEAPSEGFPCFISGYFQTSPFAHSTGVSVTSTFLANRYLTKQKVWYTLIP